MPGQRIDQVLNRLSGSQIEALVGEDVMATLADLSSARESHDSASRVASYLFESGPLDFLSEPQRLSILLSGLSPRKGNELAKRLHVDSYDQLNPVALVRDRELLAIVVGFFGGDAHDVVSSVEPEARTINPSYPLFEYQRSVSERAWHQVGDGFGRAVIHMPTGAGKTRTTMHLVCRLLNSRSEALVVWLANSVELLDQAAEEFESAWRSLGNREVSVSRYWGNSSDIALALQDGVLFAGLQKLNSLNGKEPLALLRIGSRTGLVIVDEAHIAVAPTYGAVITALADTGKSSALLGLTATPGRTWNDPDADRELSEFFFGNKVGMEVEGWEDPVSYLVSSGYLARTEFRNLDFQEESSDIQDDASEGGDYSPSLLERLGASGKRNSTVIRETSQLVAEGHQRIIVFGASVRQAEVVSCALNAIGIESLVVTGRTPKRIRTRAINHFRSSRRKPIVMCNYGVLTTGFDAPQTSAAVIARPTKSLVLYSQMVGRACRGPAAGGNERAVISTVLDLSLVGFRRVTEAFHNWEDVWQ